MPGGKVRIIFKFFLIRMIKVINIHKNLISLQDDARLKHKSDLLLHRFPKMLISWKVVATLALKINNKIRERRFLIIKVTYYDL